MIVAFSGIDSSGKTTQIDLFEQYCKEKKLRVSKIWGKGRGTPGVMLIKGIVRRDRGMNEEQKKEYRANIYKNGRKRKLLLTASILDLWWYFGLWYRIRNLFSKVLICDRYLWDTYIDFRSEFPEFDIDNWWIWKFVIKVTPKPAHSFMFIITAEESYRRDQQKGDLTLDPLEVKVAKVDKYMRLINTGRWEVVIDGTRNRDDIRKEVVKTVFPNDNI